MLAMLETDTGETSVPCQTPTRRMFGPNFCPVAAFEISLGGWINDGLWKIYSNLYNYSIHGGYKPTFTSLGGTILSGNTAPSLDRLKRPPGWNAYWFLFLPFMVENLVESLMLIHVHIFHSFSKFWDCQRIGCPLLTETRPPTHRSRITSDLQMFRARKTREVPPRWLSCFKPMVNDVW